MKLKAFCLLVLIVKQVNSKGFKYMNIEDCTSTNASIAEFKTCRIIDDGLAMNLSIHVKNPLEKVVVSVVDVIFKNFFLKKNLF